MPETLAHKDAASASTGHTLASPDPESGVLRVCTDKDTTDTTDTDTGTARPWLAAAGALCLTMPTYGLMSAWGLFQVYWAAHQLRHYAHPGAVPWIGSLFGFLAGLFGLLAGVALDSGSPRLQKSLLAAACLVYGAAFLALAWCASYAQFMACFVVAGISAAVPTTAAFVVVERAFARQHRTRPLAVGLVSAGAPLGGLLASLALRALFARHAWHASMLWLAGIIGALLLAGCLLAGPHLGGGSTFRKKEKWTADHFRDRGFLLFTACVFVFEFVLYTQWGSLPYFAASVGVGDVFYLQMAYNVGAVPGRTLPSWLAARTARVFDVTLGMTALTALTVLGVWLPLGGHSAAALYAVAVLMGVGTGSFVPLSATCLSELCRGRGYGTWLGSCYAVVGFASLVGNPVNQALIRAAGARFSVAFQGILLVVAFVLCVFVRRMSRRAV